MKWSHSHQCRKEERDHGWSEGSEVVMGRLIKILSGASEYHLRF